MGLTLAVVTKTAGTWSDRSCFTTSQLKSLIFILLRKYDMGHSRLTGLYQLACGALLIHCFK